MNADPTACDFLSARMRSHQVSQKAELFRASLSTCTRKALTLLSQDVVGIESMYQQVPSEMLVLSRTLGKGGRGGPRACMHEDVNARHQTHHRMSWYGVMAKGFCAFQISAEASRQIQKRVTASGSFHRTEDFNPMEPTSSQKKAGQLIGGPRFLD